MNADKISSKIGVGLKRSSTIFLQAVIVLVGIGILAFMLWEPLVEGRNKHAASLSEIYFHDPFLAYAYIGSIAFFMALYQAFKLLGYIGRKEVFSLQSVRALQIIKYCAIVLVGFLAGAEAFFFVVQSGKEDIAGGVMMGLFLIFVSVIVAAAAGVFEKTLQSAVDMKSENDLTV